MPGNILRPRARNGQKVTEVYLKRGVLKEKQGTSGEKRAKSYRGAPEKGCFERKAGDLGRETGKK